MALYIELYNLYAGSADTDELRNRVYAATAIASESLLLISTDAGEVAWANAVLSSQATEGSKMFQLIVSKNKGATIEQITSADDAALQAQVDSEVPSAVKAYNGVV